MIGIHPGSCWSPIGDEGRVGLSWFVHLLRSCTKRSESQKVTVTVGTTRLATVIIQLNVCCRFASLLYFFVLKLLFCWSTNAFVVVVVHNVKPIGDALWPRTLDSTEKEGPEAIVCFEPHVPNGRGNYHWLPCLEDENGTKKQRFVAETLACLIACVDGQVNMCIYICWSDSPRSYRTHCIPRKNAKIQSQ